MRIVALPGVFRPLSDSRLLAERLPRDRLAAGATVLDVCTGSGAIAVAAALRGARATAVDISRRAVVNTRLNARLNGVAVRTLRGDLLGPVGDERFDLIVSNPPYVPSPTDALPRRGPDRAIEGGRGGRRLIDRLCAEAPARLRRGGTVMIVQSSVCGERETLDRLRAAGLEPSVVDRRRGHLGPLLTRRRRLLEATGRLAPGEQEEELLVIAGTVV